MDKMRKQRFSKLKTNRAGTTMVEIMVSFVVLMIGIAAFSKMIRFASNMFAEAKDNVAIQEEFQKEYYKKDTSSMETQVAGENTSRFSLVLDKDKTDVASNKVQGVTVSIPMDNKMILKRIDKTIQGQKKYIFKYETSN